ncbi:MAG: hypothetical protein ACLPTJ_16510 [Solirubrobacteraceae bacterium]
MTDNTKTCRPGCSLSRDRFRARKALIAAILNDNPHQQAFADRGRRLTFEADPELEARLHQLVWLEHECCPFLDLVVELCVRRRSGVRGPRTRQGACVPMSSLASGKPREDDCERAARTALAVKEWDSCG